MGKPPEKSSPLIPRDPDQTVAYCADGPKTVADMATEASELAKRLPQGRYTINLHGNRYRYLLGFCASMMAGHCTLMPPNRQPGLLDEIEHLYPESYRIGEDEESDPADQNDQDSRTWSEAPEIDEQQPAIIAFTSGSTGEPAATVKSWHTLRVSTGINFNALLNGIAGRPNLVATVLCQHMWGFETTVLLPLLSNITINYKNPLYPLDIANTLAEVPSPAVLVSSPLHLRMLMRSGIELPPLARILTATAPLSAEEAAAFEDHYETEVLDAFGCTESGVIATRRTSKHSDWTLAPTFSLRPAGANTEIHADHLSGPVVLPDSVELIDQHSFKWLGRNQDMVNIAGKRGSLADLNTRLARIEGVQDGVVFQPPDAQRLAAIVVAPELDIKDVLDALAGIIEPAFMPRPLLKVDKLPRQATGKLSQAALVELFDSVRSGQRAGNHHSLAKT